MINQQLVVGDIQGGPNGFAGPRFSREEPFLIEQRKSAGVIHKADEMNEAIRQRQDRLMLIDKVGWQAIRLKAGKELG